jgi:hypothetical protein
MAKTDKLSERVHLSMTESEYNEVVSTAEKNGRNVQQEIRYRIRRGRDK